MRKISIIFSSNKDGVNNYLEGYNIELSSNLNLGFTILKLILDDISN